MTDIFAFKTSFGEDILAKIIDENDTTFTTESPAYISIQPNESGQSSVAIAPFAPTSPDSIVELYKTGILGKWKVDEKLAAEYQRIFFPGKIELLNSSPGKIII